METKPKVVLTMSRNLGLGESANASIAFEKEELNKEKINEIISIVFNVFDDRVTENNMRSLEAQKMFDEQMKQVTPIKK
jgi:hypothetical protein